MLYVISLLLLFSLSQNQIEIKDAWARPAAKNSNSALYFEVVNKGNTADTLYQVTSDVSKIVEIHETFSRGDKMGMRKTDFVVIKANSTFQFKPRAHHVMLIGLKDKMLPTQKKEFTLHFKKAGKIKVSADVK